MEEVPRNAPGACPACLWPTSDCVCIRRAKPLGKAHLDPAALDGLNSVLACPECSRPLELGHDCLAGPEK